MRPATAAPIFIPVRERLESASVIGTTGVSTVGIMPSVMRNTYLMIHHSRSQAVFAANSVTEMTVIPTIHYRSDLLDHHSSETRWRDPQSLAGYDIEIYPS